MHADAHTFRIGKSHQTHCTTPRYFLIKRFDKARSMLTAVRTVNCAHREAAIGIAATARPAAKPRKLLVVPGA
jgi:hypothetical protein